MRVSYEWLTDFVDLAGLTPQRAAEHLDMAGIEVESVTTLDLSDIWIGRVISQAPHPNSRNPLWIHQVDLGGRTEQIIAGASNAGPGAVVAVALPGTTVPSGKLVRDLTIAGVAGRGMMCSEAELGLGDDHSGIMLLTSGEPGTRLSDVYSLEAVLEVSVTSNRPDCLCHMGVARELAAVTGRPFPRDFMPPFTGGVDPPGSELAEVAIADPDLCRRYIAGVITGVRVEASPAWMQRRLRAAGVRPVNNVVDVTNYVLLEYGQPLHAFDHSRLRGGRIDVRRARPGESLRCLDGETRALDPEMLVIADAERAVAIAGVIGGEETAVSGGTTDVLLESATFDGRSVRATSRALGLRTEASTRFEKGISAELALAGARRAAALLADVAGGRVHREWPDVYLRPQEPVRVRVWPAQVDSLLGVHVPLEEAEAALRRLGFHIRVEDDGAWDVLPPVFRLDVTIPEDVVEEIGRLHGYDKVPATVPGFRRDTWRPQSPARPVDAIREVLAGAGFTETVTAGLVSWQLLKEVGLDGRALRIANPLSEEMSAPRTALVPSLLQVAAFNRDQGVSEPRFFEVSRVFLKAGDDELPDEPERVAAVAAVADGSPAAGQALFMQLKAVLDRCAREAGAPAPGYSAADGGAPLYHPGRCARVSLADEPLGTLAELHPAVLKRFGLGGRAVAAEIDLAPLLAASAPARARPVPRFPAAQRDLAVVVADAVPAAALLRTIREAAGGLLEKVTPFDEYRGSQVREAGKSVAFALTFRSPERTLTDSEVDGVMQAVRASLKREHGASLRS